MGYWEHECAGCKVVHDAPFCARTYRRGERLGLTEEELAFYDAPEVNDSPVKVLGDETLRTIARELSYWNPKMPFITRAWIEEDVPSHSGEPAEH